MKHNKGFSLIELVLALAIASILSGTAIYSLNNTKSSNLKACVNDIAAMLGKVRLLAMTKDGQHNLYIYYYNSAYYMKEAADASALDATGTLLSQDADSADGIKIKGVVDMPTGIMSYDVDNLAANHYLTIKFQRSNGAILIDLPSCPGYDYITVSNSQQSYKIRLAKYTGRHSIE